MTYETILRNLNFTDDEINKGDLSVFTPIDGSNIASVQTHSKAEVQKKIKLAKQAFKEWRDVPAPKRGELVRLLGEELRANKEALGKLVSLECGKIYQEGLGEVQEMIDICDFALGLSRQLYGLTIASEREGHAMREIWQPLGICGVISAFNFPVAVWSWNATLALVCGNSLLWKPSEKTPLTAIACQKILEAAMAKFAGAPDNLSQLIIGTGEIGDIMVSSKEVAIISATGSTRMGRIVGEKVARRFGRSILELGGNNAMIVSPSADMEMALRAIIFSAIGTAGQRCTTLRRLIVHEDIYDNLVPKIIKTYGELTIGSPLDDDNLIGPLIDEDAYDNMQTALRNAQEEAGIISGGERVLQEKYEDGYYVNPAIVEMDSQSSVVCAETFAPILYVMKYKNLEEAIETQNNVPQGLSSCIFTTDVREAEKFLSASGSDCGIANVNIGPSGAEIGGAFGGEKETGGGRESGSDAWKSYMRRQTCTVNYSYELPLAQGLKFDV